MPSTTLARRGSGMKVKPSVSKKTLSKTSKEGVKSVRTKVASVPKPDKVVKSSCHGFEIVVMVCRKCKEATEIMRCEDGRLFCREYYCCVGVPLEIHSFDVPSA